MRPSVKLLWVLFGTIAAGTAACDETNTASQNVIAADTSVVLELRRTLSRGERYEIEQRGIQVGEYLGDNRYLALVPMGSDLEALLTQLEYVEAVSPLGADEKLDDAIRHNLIPDYARSGERITVQVSFFQNREIEAKSLLAEYSAEVAHNTDAGVWVASILPAHAEELADHGVVRRVEIMADPKLLEEEGEMPSMEMEH